MNHPISISFILPTYNVDKYLSRAIESILHNPISKEIIIINDGSSDESLAIAEQYRQKYHFISVLSQPNRGVSAARNAGLKLAIGRYVYFIDPDDYLVENNFSPILEIAEKYQADVIKGLMQHSYEDGRPNEMRPPEYAQLQPNQYHICSGYTHLNHMLARDWLPSSCFSLYRREFLCDNQIYFPEGIRMTEDSLFIAEILTQEDVKVIEVGRVFYNYHHRENSATTSQNYIQDLSDVIKVCERLRDRAFYLLEQVKEDKQKYQIREKVAIDLFRIIAINCEVNYRYRYLLLNDEQKAQAKPYFKDEILHIMKVFRHTSIDL